MIYLSIKFVIVSQKFKYACEPSTMEYLRYIVSGEGVHINPNKMYVMKYGLTLKLTKFCMESIATLLTYINMLEL